MTLKCGLLPIPMTFHVSSNGCVLLVWERGRQGGRQGGREREEREGERVVRVR